MRYIADGGMGAGRIIDTPTVVASPTSMVVASPAAVVDEEKKEPASFTVWFIVLLVLLALVAYAIFRKRKVQGKQTPTMPEQVK